MRSFFLLLLFGLINLSASAQDRLFAEFTSTPGVESTYIGSSLLHATGAQNFHTGAGIISANELKLVEIIKCDDKKVVPELIKSINSIISKSGLVLMLENIDNAENETCRVYSSADGQSANIVSKVLVMTTSSDDISVVYLVGKINLQSLINIAILRSR